MPPQYLGNKELLNRKLTAFLASRMVQTAQVIDCYDWATRLLPEPETFMWQNWQIPLYPV